MIVGQRVPRNFFVTTGKGESDITIHAGSYHMALKDADIEMCNIMQYSSILPGKQRRYLNPKVDTWFGYGSNYGRVYLR